MTRKIKLLIFIGLLFISVGYAALNTSLDLTSMVLFNFNAEDFQVYVSRVELDNKNISENINEAGSIFTFQPSTASQILSYRVRNVSTQYDAYVTLSCDHSDSITLNINHIGTIAAQTIETRTIEITNPTEEVVTCTLNIDKVERTENAANACCNNAESITFEPEDPNWEVTTVEEALDYLRARDN